MTTTHQDNLFLRLRQAWENYKQRAPEAHVARTKEILRHHHKALFHAESKGEATASEFSLAHAVLEGVLDKELCRVMPLFYDGITAISDLEQKLDTELAVLADGNIVGSGKYQVMDLDWLEAIITWLDHQELPKPSFPQPGIWIEIPDKVKIAIFGDWGGGTWKGNSVARSISHHIAKLGTDINIHLGDVYYFGGSEQEQNHLLALWPKAPLLNLTLNSNHEMYPLGKGYFDTTLANALFEKQQGKSFFALENSYWIVVGLDSAYDGDKDGLYLQGGLNPIQTEFLQRVAAKGKPVIVLCHHNGLSFDGKSKTALWEEVVAPLNGQLKYWYWGHKHAAAVYNPVEGIQCRVAGHGVIPWGNASLLQNSDAVQWYEHNPPSPKDGVRVQNGFAVLSLEDEQLSEAFYGEDGNVHWS